MLAVAKSPRALADRELVGFDATGDDETMQAATGQVHTLVSAEIDRSGEPVTVQIDLLGSVGSDGLRGNGSKKDGAAASEPGGWPGHSFVKVIRVNGAPRRASELVGEVNAVLFSAQDLELVYGPPSIRRRYLDVLISQHDRPYLRALQRYQRAVTQRNHLLRAIRNGRSRHTELAPWDERLAQDGGYIVAARSRSMTGLQVHAAAVYSDLAAGTQAFEVAYEPSFAIPQAPETQVVVATALAAALTESAGRDTAQGHTSVGPHRDDMRILIDGADAARYASRGQARSGVLALKLAEAEFLSGARGETPVILLDDVLSELDPGRRELVLDRVAGYDQCLITTAELDAVDPARRAGMHIYEVRAGTVIPSVLSP